MDATLITAWEALCQELAPAFTRPTFITFLHLATGWALCRCRPTVTSLICTIGSTLLGHVARHWTVYEKFFYRAAWSLPQVSQLLLTRIIVPLLQQCALTPEIHVAIDDTTCGRCGKHVAWAGYFKDASASNTTRTVVHWAHNWVLGVVTLRPKRWPNWVLGLPVLFALYRKPRDCDGNHPFRTRQQIAAQMIHTVHTALPEGIIRWVADGQYATKELATAAAQERSNLVSRLRRDAALYHLPPARNRRPRGRGRQRGRPRKRGRRLPSPRKLARRKTGWRTVEVRVYGRRVQRRVWSLTCLWYHVAKDRPIKLVIVRDPTGVQDDDFLFCTDPGEDDVRIIERFAARWPIEECIHDGKQLGGFEQVQGWCRHTVERQAPFALVVQTLVKAWYLLYGVEAHAEQPRGPALCGWLRDKEHPSYLDMLATLRRVLWNHRLLCNSTLLGRLHKIWEPLRFTLCAAA